jgi:hypothetical protein
MMEQRCRMITEKQTTIIGLIYRVLLKSIPYFSPEPANSENKLSASVPGYDVFCNWDDAGRYLLTI